MFKPNCLKVGALSLIAASLAYPLNLAADETDAAPSLHLKYRFSNDEKKTDILVNSLKVTSKCKDTYCSLINGNLFRQTPTGSVDEDGMYCGLQYSGSSYEQRRLYSIWNPFIRFNDKVMVKCKDTCLLTAQPGDIISAGDSVLYRFENEETFKVSHDSDIYTIKIHDTVIRANEPSYLSYDYVLPTVNPSTFGGEGRGAQVKEIQPSGIFENYNWYTFVTRVWDEDRSKFGCWFYDHKNNKWLHYCTLGYPASNMYFKMYIDAFLENWTDSGDSTLRSYDQKGAWARGADGEWEQPQRVDVESYWSDGQPGGRCRKRFNEVDVILNADSSITMKTGAGISPTVYNYGDTFDYPANLSLSEPAFAKLALVSVSLFNDTLKWKTTDGGLPQFSYSYQVFDSGTGAPVFSSPVKFNSEDSSVVLGLKRDDVQVALTLTDIFDNELTVTVVPQKKEVLPSSSCDALLKNVQPNSWGTMLEVPVNSAGGEFVDIKVVDEYGNKVACFLDQPQLMHGPHVHQLYLNTQNLDAQKVYTIKAEVGGNTCSSNFSLANGMFDAPTYIASEDDYRINYVYTDGNNVVASVYASNLTNSILCLSSATGHFFNEKPVMLQPGDNEVVLELNERLTAGTVYFFNAHLNGKPSLSQGFVVK